MSEEEAIPPELERKLLRRLLESLRRALYEIQASNGIARGNATYTSPQVFALARDALYFQAILRAARVLDHHEKAASYFKMRALQPDIADRVAKELGFDQDQLERFAGKLRKIRNRALAHEDVEDIRQGRNVWEEHPITAGELIACLQFAFAALDAMLEARYGESIELLGYTGRDAEEIARKAEELGLPAKWSRQLL